MTGHPYGIHKTVITFGGSAEGFMNLAIVGLLKEIGTVAGLRVFNGKMNKDAEGNTVYNQSERYNFKVAERIDISNLRENAAGEILDGTGETDKPANGRRLFTEQDVKGKVSGRFSFIGI